MIFSDENRAPGPLAKAVAQMDCTVMSLPLLSG